MQIIARSTVLQTVKIAKSVKYPVSGMFSTRTICGMGVRKVEKYDGHFQKQITNKRVPVRESRESANCVQQTQPFITEWCT
eukprot:6176899-Pleurochrysis_carterae.AAC.1